MNTSVSKSVTIEDALDTLANTVSKVFIISSDLKNNLHNLLAPTQKDSVEDSAGNPSTKYVDRIMELDRRVREIGMMMADANERLMVRDPKQQSVSGVLPNRAPVHEIIQGTPDEECRQPTELHWNYRKPL